MAFKMKGYSAFTQTDNDDEYQKKWKSNQNPKTLEKNLKSFEANLKEAIEKGDIDMANMIRKDIESVKKQLKEKL